MKRIIVPAVFIAAMLVSPMAWAAAAPDLKPGPFEAHLSELYSARQYDALAIDIVSPNDAITQVRVVNWLRDQEVKGGLSTFITIMNASRLWVMSAKLPVEQRARMKEDAASEYLLTKWLIRTEGFQCADAASVQRRSTLFFDSEQGKEIQSFIDQSAPDRLFQMRRTAELMMILSFSGRKNDDWLCRAGPSLSAKYAEKHPDATGTPNNDSKIEVSDDPSIEADFVPYSEWKRKRIEAVNALDAELGLPPVPTVVLERDGKMK